MIFLSIAILAVCCDDAGSQKRELATLLKKEFNVKLNSNIERIFILNDTKCAHCVTAFSEYVKENINDPRSLVIVQSRGWNIDIDGFKNNAKTNPNIIVSHNINTTDKFISKLGVIYLSSNDIDTVISISPLSINDQIYFIESKKK